MPTKEQQLKIELTELIERQIREHKHDGNQATQVDTLDLFDQQKDIRVIRYEQMVAVDFATAVTVADGKHYLHIPAKWDKFFLVEAHAEHITAGSVSANTTVQVANVTQSVDMLSTLINIDTGEAGSDESTTAVVIDSANNQVSENDLLRIDVDTVQANGPAGLIVTLGFRYKD